MTFFIDINIPASFADFLKKQGHEVILGAESGFHGKTDWEICEFAAKNDSIIITHDLDFGELLAVSGASKPSVIIFRVQPLTKQMIEETFQQTMVASEHDLIRGAIVVIEKNKYRLRRLPIRKYQ